MKSWGFVALSLLILSAQGLAAQSGKFEVRILFVILPILALSCCFAAWSQSEQSSMPHKFMVRLLAFMITMFSVLNIVVSPLLIMGGHGRPFRPFLRKSAKPKSKPTAGWTLPLTFTLPHLNEADTRELAQRWHANARAEAASIPAFTYLATDLLALGASSDLVNRALQAAQDEVEHARAFYSLTGLITGKRLGLRTFRAASFRLSRLPFLPRTRAIRRLAIDSVRDGLIHESLAAARLTMQATRCHNTELRLVLERIAKDESGHVDLANDIVSWSLSELGPSLLPALQKTWLKTQKKLAALRPVKRSAGLESLGELDSDDEKKLRDELSRRQPWFMQGRGHCSESLNPSPSTP